MPAVASLLTAADTKTRSPHTIGLDTDTPATGVFHNTFVPAAASQVTGIGEPSATPDAAGPRNIGQFCAETIELATIQATTGVNESKRVIFFPLCAGAPPPAPTTARLRSRR